MVSSLEEGIMKKRLLTSLAVLTGMFLLSASMVWAQSAPVAKTGQTTCYNLDNGFVEISCAGTGQDGEYQKGVASPSPRFTDNGDGTVTDNLTGLMWAKDAHLGGNMNWNGAIDFANNLSLGTSCGEQLTDWRLPNVKELQSLIDFNNYDPALPTGHPFTNVQSKYYWTSTTQGQSTSNKWQVNIHDGLLRTNSRISTIYNVWPVRGGN